VENSTTNPPVAVGTLPYMAPELITLLYKNKTEGQTSNKPDLKMCDVYSFGNLANEVFTQKKPFKGLTDENCFQKIIIDKEKPQLPKEKEKVKNVTNVTFVILVKSCWGDDPGNRTTFSKLLEPKLA